MSFCCVPRQQSETTINHRSPLIDYHCVRTSLTYRYPYTFRIYCDRCYIIKNQPAALIPYMFHGLTDKFLRTLKCLECKRDLFTYRCMKECRKCLAAYITVLERLVDQGRTHKNLDALFIDILNNEIVELGVETIV